MDARLISYLYCFNVQRDYFECHEYGEALWLDSGRPQVLKGLIQAAVCLYHLEGGNARGGWRMWNRARRYLLDYLHDVEEVEQVEQVDQVEDIEHLNLTDLVRDIDNIWLHVPNSLHTKIVRPDEISQLHLPHATIQLKDFNLEQTVATWSLSVRPEDS